MKKEILDLIKVKDYIGAEEQLKIYKSKEPDDFDIFNLEAIILYNKGQIDNALNILKLGAEKFPHNEVILRNISSLFDIKGDKVKAVEFFCLNKLYNTETLFLNDTPKEYKENSNDLNIVYGSMEIANQMSIMTKTLRQQGHNAKGINYYNSIFKYENDEGYDINKFSDVNEANLFFKGIAARNIASNNIFHFYFGTSLTLDFSDIFLINSLGKKCIMQHWGSDVRMYSKAVKLNPYVRVKITDEDMIKRKLEFLGKYISHCIVDYELREYVKDFYENTHLMRIAVDLEKFKFIENVKSHNEKLLIVHAPSDPRIKGSEFILRAIESLKNKYDFEFKLVYQMSHVEAKEWYAKADIIVDQVIMGNYGMLAVEGMAMGKPVISWISDFMREQYPKELPVIVANSDNIEKVLEDCIRNRDSLSLIGKNGRKYVEKYHDANIICNEVIDIYKGL